jgi:hypothetical protein
MSLMTWTRTRLAYVARTQARRKEYVVSEASGRAVVNAHRTPFLPYDLEGPVQPEMSWLPVSFDRKSGQGC